MAISKPTKTARKGKTVQPSKKVVVEEPTTDPESPVSSGSDEVPVIKKVIKKKIIRKKVAKKPAVTKDTAKSKKTVKSKKKPDPEPTSDVDEEDKSQESQEESQEEPEAQESEPEVSSQESEVEKSPEKPKRKATKAQKSKPISPIKKQKPTSARRQRIAEPNTQESGGTQSPGPKVSEQDSLSIHVPNHTMNDPSITMNEMVFNAIKKELSENGKDTFTYQSIEKRMKIEGSDTVRKCIKALLEKGVLENKKKAKKFIGKMQGQLELMKGNYYEALERTTEQLINDVLPENHLEETFTVKDLNDEVPKASSTAKKPTRVAASKTKVKGSKKVAAIEPKTIEEKLSFSEDNDSENDDEQISMPIVAPPTPPRKKVVKKTKVDAAKNKRRRSRSIVMSKTSKKLPTKKLEKEKKVEKKVVKARGRPTRARKEVVEESDDDDKL